jgi:hypothetical protein
LIEFPSKPTSAVLGDQDSFRLEYIGNSVTIKPLAAHARSNLFVFSDSGRFSLILVSGPSSEVDYLVQVKRAPVPLDAVPVAPRSILLHRSARFQGFTLTALSVTPILRDGPADSVISIQFQLRSDRDTYSFHPTALGVRAGENYLALDKLTLDSLQLAPDTLPVHGEIQIKSTDLPKIGAIQLVFAVPDKPPLGAKEPEHALDTHRLVVSLGQPIVSPVKNRERRKGPFVEPEEH